MVKKSNRKPLFRHQLTSDEWKLVEEYAQKLNTDYEQRAKIMLKRLDVTFDSFLWSDRVKKLEDKVMTCYKQFMEELEVLPPVGVDDLIAASTGDLIFLFY